MAFKMKAGKEGPMRKNFPNDISPIKSNKFIGELATARKEGRDTFKVDGETFNVEN